MAENKVRVLGLRLWIRVMKSGQTQDVRLTRRIKVKTAEEGDREIHYHLRVLLVPGIMDLVKVNPEDNAENHLHFRAHFVHGIMGHVKVNLKSELRRIHQAALMVKAQPI